MTRANVLDCPDRDIWPCFVLLRSSLVSLKNVRGEVHEQNPLKKKKKEIKKTSREVRPVDRASAWKVIERHELRLRYPIEFTVSR